MPTKKTTKPKAPKLVSDELIDELLAQVEKFAGGVECLRLLMGVPSQMMISRARRADHSECSPPRSQARKMFNSGRT